MKKFLNLLLVLALVLSLVPAAMAEDRVTWPENPEPVTLTMFADCTWLPYDEFSGIIPQWIEKETGIKLELTKATDSNQLPLMVASGDIGYDLIMTDSSDMFRELSSDLTWAYDELIAQYVPNWEVPAVEQAMNGYYNANYAEDKHYYMLKNYFNTVEEVKACDHLFLNSNQFYIRTDIFNTLGIDKLPNNEAEVMATLAAVKEQYPDMVPMVFQHRNKGAFAQLVGLDFTMPHDANGNLVHHLSDPTYREYLRVINAMYREGYILEENFAFNSDEQFYQYQSDGTGFMFASFGGTDDLVFTARAKSTNPDALIEQLPLMDKYAQTFGIGGWAGCFISKTCSNPEAAIKLIAWMKDGDNQYASQAGEYGIDWEWDENGVFKALDRYNEANANGAVDATYTGVAFLLCASTYISEGAIGYATASDSTKLAFDQALERANFSNLIGMATPEANTDEAIIKTNLNDLETEYFPIVCLSASDEEFDANFTKMMEEAEAIGIDQYNTWFAAKYAELCETFGGV